MRNVVILFILVFTVISVAQTDAVIEWKKRPDLVTERIVWQITSHDSASEAVYFEQQPFTTDDKYLVFKSKRTGDWLIYRADLQTGEIALVSKEINPGTISIGPDGQHVWYTSDNKLFKTDVATLEEKIAFDFKDSFKDQRISFSGSLSADGVYTLVRTYTDTSRSIYRVNLESGDVEHALTVNNSEGTFSHPLINPKYPHLISYVPGPDTQNDMTLPMEKRARTWIINMKTGENKQFLTMPYGFRATHEKWSADGELFTFFRKTVPGWTPVSICSINKDGSNFQVYYSHNNIRLGHGLSSDDGKWFVSDGQDPHYNPIILINMETGLATTLCWPNSSIYGGLGTTGHVHPSISKSGRFVCYSSDLTGTPQVYVVPTGIE